MISSNVSTVRFEIHVRNTLLEPRSTRQIPIALPLFYHEVNARKTNPFLCHNQSDGVAIGHSFWKIKSMYLKFLLEMDDLEVIIFSIFQKNLIFLKLNFNLANLSHFVF